MSQLLIRNISENEASGTVLTCTEREVIWPDAPPPLPALHSGGSGEDKSRLTSAKSMIKLRVSILFKLIPESAHECVSSHILLRLHPPILKGGGEAPAGQV